MRRWLCALACTAIVASTHATGVAMDQRAVLTLRINTVEKSTATVVLRGDDVLVRRADLIAAGLKGFTFNSGGKADDLVALSALRPDLTFQVDDVQLALNLTVTPAHLDATVVDFHPQQSLALERPVRSAFLNYSLATSSQSGMTISEEFGTHIGAGMFSSTASFAGSNLYRSNITRWVFDSPSSDRRITVGDVVASTGDFGGTVAIAGFGVQRYFGLNPTLTKTVLPQISGAALTPSTADIYVNGTLTQHETLPPGQFAFQNLPAGEGPNVTTVVVTDAFGRQQTYSNYFYGADSLLARGLSDFSYAAGVLHPQFGQSGNHGLAAAGRYAIGVTNDLTAGGRLEISPTLVSFGPAMTFRLHGGVLSTAAALSRQNGVSGAAALASYLFTRRRSSGAFSFAYESPHYASLALSPDDDRPVLNASFSIASQLSSRSGIGISFIEQNDRDTGSQRSWQIFQNQALSNTMQLQITESLTSQAGIKRFGIATTLNFVPRPGMNGSITAVESGGATTTTVQLEHALSPQTPSFGYTLSASAGAGSTSEFASGAYRGQYGTYLADASIAPGTRSLDATAAGGVVFIGGRVFATQPLTDSYALVDTGGLANVRIIANNVVVGRTGKSGMLIVPALGSYYDNDITIATADTPLNYSIDRETQRVAPMYRSGAIVRFGVNRVTPVTGSLRVAFGSRQEVPAFGLLQVDAGAQSDIGEDGEFYFDTLAAGTHHATITFKDGQCRFDFTVPQTTAPFVKLGTLLCKDGVRS